MRPRLLDLAPIYPGDVVPLEEGLAALEQKGASQYDVDTWIDLCRALRVHGIAWRSTANDAGAWCDRS